ncbi:MAG: Nramp family divalent metal transporter, partial [Planctomycetes bacterium]|nr:Nramp family divalent metal transporter [Planctomycetota bacterium]
MPIRRIEDANGNGKLDEGEDWDGDGHLDVKEPSLKPVFDVDGDGEKDATDANEDGVPDPVVMIRRGDATIPWPDFDRDGEPDEKVMLDTTGDGKPDSWFLLDENKDGKLDSFVDIDGDRTRDGDNLDNMIVAVVEGRPFPEIDFGMMAFLCALVAIAGLGGLTNSVFSNYTREQGWGMGAHVGAIPSMIGGRTVRLSHVGTVFEPTDESLPRWRRWVRHVVRDQVAVWMPACFVGVALPAMLSLMFLPRGFVMEDMSQIAVMTANGVRDGVGATWGPLFWVLIQVCGFLVLAPSIT